MDRDVSVEIVGDTDPLHAAGGGENPFAFVVLAVRFRDQHLPIADRKMDHVHPDRRHADQKGLATLHLPGVPECAAPAGKIVEGIVRDDVGALQMRRRAAAVSRQSPPPHADASVRTTSLSLARRTCAGFCDRMLATTTGSELTGHWTRMRRSLARFSGPVSLIHAPSLADSITTTLEFRFSVHTGPAPRRRGRADRTNGKRGSGEPLRTDSHRFRTVQYNRAPLCQLACTQTRSRRFRRRLAPGMRQRPR